MRRGLQAILLLGLVGVVGVAHAGGNKNKMDGVWKAKSLIANGETQPKSKHAGLSLVIKGDEYTINLDGKNIGNGTFKTDDSKKPQTIDINAKSPDGKATKLLGIYKIEGNTMTVCAVPSGKDRPQEFTSKKGSGRDLIVYERKK